MLLDALLLNRVVGICFVGMSVPTFRSCSFSTSSWKYNPPSERVLSSDTDVNFLRLRYTATVLVCWST